MTIYNLIYFPIAGLIFLFAILSYRFPFIFIAGLNTLPKKERGNIQIEKLKKLIFIASSILSLFILSFALIPKSLTSWLFPLVVIAYAFTITIIGNSTKYKK